MYLFRYFKWKVEKQNPTRYLSKFQWWFDPEHLTPLCDLECLQHGLGFRTCWDKPDALWRTIWQATTSTWLGQKIGAGIVPHALCRLDSPDISTYVFTWTWRIRFKWRTIFTFTIQKTNLTYSYNSSNDWMYFQVTFKIYKSCMPYSLTAVFTYVPYL